MEIFQCNCTLQLQMLLFPNALCCSLYERNCVCAVTNIFTKFLPANNFCQLLRVTRKCNCTSAGNGQAQLHFRDDQQRAFGFWQHLQLTEGLSNSFTTCKNVYMYEFHSFIDNFISISSQICTFVHFWQTNSKSTLFGNKDSLAIFSHFFYSPGKRQKSPYSTSCSFLALVRIFSFMFNPFRMLLP